MQFRRKLFVILVICSLQASTASKKNTTILNKNIKVLFIGNNLTFANNLSKLVKKETLYLDVTLETTMIAYPNYALINHWNDGEIQKLIAKNNYDVVIVQQGSSSQPEGRRMLLVDGAKIKALCHTSKTKLIYFMVWPSKQYYYTFDDVIKNHIHAATKNDALLAPVGVVRQKLSWQLS